MLDACNRALRAGFQILTAYDMEPAPDGDYTWLTDGFRNWGYADYEVFDRADATAVGDSLVIYDDESEEAARAVAAFTAFENLLEDDSDFLTLWTDPWSGRTAMQTSYVEIGFLLSKLEAAYEFIQAEDETDQDHDIIKQMLINELDNAIAEIGGDLPEFIGTWETIPDVIDWIEQIMAGPYTIEIPTSETETYDLVVNISALFLTPIADLKTKLPYMEFLTPDEWVTDKEDDIEGPYYRNPTSTFYLQVVGEEVELENISVYVYVNDEWDINDPAILIDGPDGVEIDDDDYYYFPDYTFGGLFPELDRAGWIEFLDAIEPEPM